MFFPIAHLSPEQKENMFKRLNEYRKKEEERLEQERKNNLIKESIEKARKEREEKQASKEQKRKEIMDQMTKNPPTSFSAIMGYGQLLSNLSK
jgi:hypothetical protein